MLVTLGDVDLGVRLVRVGREDRAPEGPVLVFLHDSLGCVETWRDFPETMAERVGLDAIVYDRRGYGQSSPFGNAPRTPRYLEEEAGVLFDVIDAARR